MLKIVFVSAVVLLGIIQNIEVRQTNARKLFNKKLVYFLTKGGIPPEMKDAAAALHAACVTETGVSEDAIQAAGSGTFANDQALKCYMKCTWEKMGVVSFYYLLQKNCSKFNNVIIFFSS